MAFGENIFYNSTEKRLRAFWRLSVQFALFSGAYFFPVIFLDYIDSSFFRVLFDETLTLLLVLASIWISTKFLDKRDFRTLGFFNVKSWIPELLQGLLIGTIIFLLVFLVEFSLGWVKIDSFAIINNPFETSLKLFGRFIGFFFVAVMEEAFTRGYQLKNLSEGFNIPSVTPAKTIVAALIVSSFIFGLLHGENPNISIVGVINLSVIGLFYGYAYIATGSLAMPIGIHTAWNFVQGNIFGYAVSGIDPEVSFIRISQHGSLIITGGNFGPEGGLVILLGVVFGVFAINLIKTGNALKFNVVKDIAIYK